MDHDLLPGTHLTTSRRGYIHHGLYVGAGRVIHYRGFSRHLRRGPVEEVSLEAFAQGHGWHVKAWVAPAFPGQAAVDRARCRLGEDRYRLCSNNCEHFVEWCLGGSPRSAQVDAWTKPLRRGLAALAWLPPRGRSQAPHATA
jgi:hypothetical protein